ncbi:MAG: 2,3-bisphosphoglycerate-independent phosphoglycerate mutase [Clostridiales bacterium]|jgi:2,3-bisphosphoglycerate-independent phosphoglycerate mutase|nr:2,3-bisphosphoglycerate-independent phosphoglycerate mutase [Clostridiales bacterium]
MGKKTRFSAMIILDGFGYSKATDGNAIRKQGIPNIRALKERYPHSLLGASGMDVGLPDGQMGNSEVGHLNIGAGRIVYQDFTRISKSITDGDFFTNEVFLRAVENAKRPGKKLHLIGLLGPGGVHSHIDHLYALLKLAKDREVPEVYVHCFLDGRDLPPCSASAIIGELEKKMKEIGTGKIASVVGRYYAMDRDNRWDRVKRAYDLLTYGNGISETSAVEAVLKSYMNNVSDEFVLPTVIVSPETVPGLEKPFNKPIGVVGAEDSIIFYNFRPDRAREITRAFTEESFDGFERFTGYLKPVYVCLTRYDDTFSNVEVAFKPQSLKNTLGEYIASQGLKQLRIAETEKYAHVTFFFNGGSEIPNEGETREMINSPKVATYDLKPSMSAYEVTERAVELILSKEFDAVILNFANCDMVGHTGSMNAAVQAVGVVDECVKKVITAVQKVGGTAIITADHGNADKMTDIDGSIFTAHSTNPVPVIVVDTHKKREIRDGGKLCDLAPTMLELMGLPVPPEMSGKSLLK